MNPTKEDAGTAVQSEERVDLLTAKDRCDAGECWAQAYVQAQLLNGTLLFCGHHFNRHEQKLRASAIAIHDERWKLSDGRLDVSA